MLAEIVLMVGCQNGTCQPVQATAQATSQTYVFTSPQTVTQSVTVKQRVNGNGLFARLRGCRPCGNAAAGTVNTTVRTRTQYSVGCRGGLCR